LKCDYNVVESPTHLKKNKIVGKTGKNRRITSNMKCTNKNSNTVYSKPVEIQHFK